MSQIREALFRDFFKVCVYVCVPYIQNYFSIIKIYPIIHL